MPPLQLSRVLLGLAWRGRTGLTSSTGSQELGAVVGDASFTCAQQSCARNRANASIPLTYCAGGSSGLPTVVRLL
jgi:hypothetical protein